MGTGLLQVASTFDCSAIAHSLQRALADARIADGVGFIPPTQISNYMLSPASDTEGVLGTIVLVRVEDWLREYVKSVPEPAGHSRTRVELRTRLDEFLSHLAVLSLRGSPVWFLICPSTGWLSEHYKLSALCRTYTNLLAARVSNLSQVMTLTWPPSWSSAGFDDHDADLASHTPFREAGFDRLGEFIGPQLARTLAKGESSASSAGAGSPELAAFLAGLRVQVEVAPAEQRDRAHIDRILRTAASFSLAGEKPTIQESEIDAILASNHCLLISVTDRLSVSGPSGVVVASSTGDALIVGAMSLSCTVLGRQVEFAVVSALAQIAADRNVDRIVFEYRPSGRNQPALAFLRSFADQDTDQRFVLPITETDTRINNATVAPTAWSLKVVTAKSAG
jgi:hypothetical protein